MLLTPSLIFNDENGKSVALRKSGIFGQRIYIVPRSECSFRRVGLVNKGRNAINAVLLRLKKEALSPNSYFKVLPDKQGVRAGAWEFQKTSPHISYRFLPESLVREPKENGARLVECLEGFEGQIWHDGDLISSRWWSNQPHKKQWLAFLRAVEAEAEVIVSELPPAEKVPFRRDIPIWDVSRERMVQVFSPSTLLIAGLTGLSCFAIYSSAQIVHSWLAISEHNQKIESVSKETETVISQRNQAIRNVQYTQRLNGLGHKGQVIIALAEVAEVIKGNDLKLSWVRYSDGNFEVGLATDFREDGAQISIPQFVASMEVKPALSNVSMAVRSEKLLTINAEIDLDGMDRDDQSIGQ